jgi:hypothetical protein
MRTRLDATLFALLDAHPDWSASLTPEQQQMLLRRRNGTSLNQIAAEYGLSPATVRFRLYGKGMGLKRAGGILGHLRWLNTRGKQLAGMPTPQYESERSETDEQADCECGG